MNKTILLAALLYLGFTFRNCQPKKQNNSWIASFQGLGTNSSPRLADLNRDGILDVVIGAGRNEWEASDTAVMALDGATGKLLWKVAAPNQVVGSACFLDVNGDSIPDVFIGGRSTFLVGIDGSNGQLLWSYSPPQDTAAPLKYARHNFYNVQPIPDQTGDSVPDLLVPNGGNPRAYPNTADGREPGLLMVMDSKTGRLIAAVAMPDGKETYMSPLVADFEGNGELEVIFGTGGETIGGNLYRAALADVVKGDLSRVKLLKHVEGHGFIAPPSLADVTKDGIPDIILNNQGGTVFAFDGASDSLLWQLRVDSTECSSSLAVGFFNNDDVPDFFGHFSVGAWPDNFGGKQVAINGRNGTVIQQWSLGCTGFFSPVVFDINGDGIDEVLLPVNEYNCTGIHVTDAMHYLALFDFKKGVSEFTQKKKLKNLSSTPWVGDMDGDGLLDVVYCVQANTSKIIEFFGMAIVRSELLFPADLQPSWQGYMGEKGDGIFRKNKTNLSSDFQRN